jgi:hypothetical protein
MFASIVTMLLSQVKAGKRSAHPCAFNFPVPQAVDGVKIVIEGFWFDADGEKRNAMNQRSEEQQNRKCFYALAVRPATTIFRLLPIIRHILFVIVSAMKNETLSNLSTFRYLGCPLNID